ncbi:hypothetical protein GOV04_05680 [Candidatus Woesearchaeota archaeon]|nr:hypothetical protein [Candidatus Woesearchaeota archaeon]
MTKKTTKKEPEQDNQVQTKFWVIGALVVLSILIIFFSLPKLLTPKAQSLEELLINNYDQKEGENNYIYNGFSFIKYDGLWWTQLSLYGDVYFLPLHFGPRESKQVPITGQLSKSFDASNQVYITFDPEQTTGLQYTALAASEIGLSLKKALLRQGIAACTKNNSDACYNRPIITCDNTELPVIYLEHSNNTQIILDDNCIIVQGQNEELVRATDRMLLTWYQIMQR